MDFDRKENRTVYRGQPFPAADLAHYVPSGPTNAKWVEINDGKHGGAALAVWCMEDEKRSPDREAFVERLIAAHNACDGVPTNELDPGKVKHLLFRTGFTEGFYQSRLHMAGDAIETLLKTIKGLKDGVEADPKVLAYCEHTLASTRNT